MSCSKVNIIYAKVYEENTPNSRPFIHVFHFLFFRQWWCLEQLAHASTIPRGTSYLLSAEEQDNTAHKELGIWQEMT